VARGDPFVSPWVWAARDFQGSAITITVNFNNNNRALQNSSVVRDAGCLYSHIYIGLGPDGTPNSTPHTFTVPFGTTQITAGQFSAVGLNTIDDILALQITAGP
jgi:hypothetical protein